jgi:hypothetical protein
MEEAQLLDLNDPVAPSEDNDIPEKEIVQDPYGNA